MKVIGFLQNAWSPLYAGGEWPRPSWLAALAKSRSGQRLKLLESKLYEIEYHNCTPIVGATADSVVKPDITHVVAMISGRPTDDLTIVTFGSIAERAILRAFEAFPNCMAPYEKCGILALPHPAYRVVTNALFDQARSLLEGNLVAGIRIRLRQMKNCVIQEGFR